MAGPEWEAAAKSWPESLRFASASQERDSVSQADDWPPVTFAENDHGTRWAGARRSSGLMPVPAVL